MRPGLRAIPRPGSGVGGMPSGAGFGGGVHPGPRRPLDAPGRAIPPISEGTVALRGVSPYNIAPGAPNGFGLGHDGMQQTPWKSP